jgi:predicted ATPase
LGESGEVSRFEALRSGETPLVGRDNEVDLLLRRWEQAKSAEGRVVLVSGEPGIGKSRLTAALSEHLGNEPHTRLRYFCSPHHQDSALYPFIAQLERAAGFARDDTVEAKLGKLQALLAPIILEARRLADDHAEQDRAAAAAKAWLLAQIGKKRRAPLPVAETAPRHLPPNAWPLSARPQQPERGTFERNLPPPCFSSRRPRSGPASG